jgi:hypothetical protein
MKERNLPIQKLKTSIIHFLQSKIQNIIMHEAIFWSDGLYRFDSLSDLLRLQLKFSEFLGRLKDELFWRCEVLQLE